MAAVDVAQRHCPIATQPRSTPSCKQCRRLTAPVRPVEGTVRITALCNRSFDAVPSQNGGGRCSWVAFYRLWRLARQGGHTACPPVDQMLTLIDMKMKINCHCRQLGLSRPLRNYASAHLVPWSAGKILKGSIRSPRDEYAELDHPEPRRPSCERLSCRVRPVFTPAHLAGAKRAKALIDPNIWPQSARCIRAGLAIFETLLANRGRLVWKCQLPRRTSPMMCSCKLLGLQ
jgi:hypothetical protein